MAGKGNLVRRFFPARAPLEGVEVNDSTWDEWESVVGDPADGVAPAGKGDASPAGEKPARAGEESPQRGPAR